MHNIRSSSRSRNLAAAWGAPKFGDQIKNNLGLGTPPNRQGAVLSLIQTRGPCRLAIAITLLQKILNNLQSHKGVSFPLIASYPSAVRRRVQRKVFI